MTEVPEIKMPTPGQALYAVIAERFVDDDDITGWSAWEELEESARQVYEDAAQAGTDARIAAIVKAAGGSAVIVAFNHPLSARDADQLHLRWADQGPERVELVIVEDVAAVAVRGNAQLTFTPAGYEGPAQHTYTAGCDGFHEPGQCPRLVTARQERRPSTETGLIVDDEDRDDAEADL